MKKILLLSCFLALFISCQKGGDELKELKNKQLDAEKFFEKVSNMEMNISNDKVLLISYNWNAEDKKIELLSSEEVEPSWGLAFDVGDNLTKRGAPVKDGYKVNCSNGDNSWTKICDGKFSCGHTIYDCLKEGGCATICKASMVYVPEIKTFYLAEDITKLIELEIK